MTKLFAFIGACRFAVAALARIPIEVVRAFRQYDKQCKRELSRRRIREAVRAKIKEKEVAVPRMVKTRKFLRGMDAVWPREEDGDDEGL